MNSCRLIIGSSREVRRGISSSFHFTGIHGGELLYLWLKKKKKEKKNHAKHFLAVCDAVNLYYAHVCVIVQLKYMAMVLSAVYAKTIWRYNNAGFRLACRYAMWSSLAVSELQLVAATSLWLYHQAASLLRWIEFNCLRSATVGKVARLSIYWQDSACRLVIPLRQVALAELYKYHHQSGNAVSGELVWKQHNSPPYMTD